ncbi:MAG: hypothetical protein ACE5KA_00860 [Nitrososphaerales archaeon]
MGTIGIPFTEEMYGIIIREAGRKKIQPETLLKIWILERAKAESSKIVHVTKDPMVDLVSVPLKMGYILTASATATISMLVEELVR